MIGRKRQILSRPISRCLKGNCHHFFVFLFIAFLERYWPVDTVKKFLVPLLKYFLSYKQLKTHTTPTHPIWAGLIDDVKGWVHKAIYTCGFRGFDRMSASGSDTEDSSSTDASPDSLMTGPYSFEPSEQGRRNRSSWSSGCRTNISLKE